MTAINHLATIKTKQKKQRCRREFVLNKESIEAIKECERGTSGKYYGNIKEFFREVETEMKRC